MRATVRTSRDVDGEQIPTLEALDAATRRALDLVDRGAWWGHARERAGA